MPRKKRPIKERLENLSIPEPNSGCWIFIGNINRGGYGQITMRENGLKKLKRAHRVSYECFKGFIGNSLVLHKCDNRCCINPDHLYLGNNKQNSKDISDRSRNFNKNKTRCNYGHSLSGENLYITPSGARRCVACNSNLSRKLYRKKPNADNNSLVILIFILILLKNRGVTNHLHNLRPQGVFE